jgi:hypothetical protein
VAVVAGRIYVADGAAGLVVLLTTNDTAKPFDYVAST